MAKGDMARVRWPAVLLGLIALLSFASSPMAWLLGLDAATVDLLDRPGGDAPDRCGDRLAAIAVADRIGGHRPRQSRYPGLARPLRRDQPDPHRRARRICRLDDRGAAGARRGAGDSQPRFRPCR